MRTESSSDPSQALQRRTRNGCHTCKKRRKRCDERQPTCGGCARLGLTCAYVMNIRWGTTREAFDIATMPQTGLGAASSPNDELHDLLRSIGVTLRLHRLIDSTLDREGRAILLKFLCYGYRLLASNFATNDVWLTTHFPMCEHSKACLLSLLAFQAAVDPVYNDVFDQYYDQALTQFTKEACKPGGIREGSLFFAGLFMCTISLSRLMPYTNHLNAIIAMATPEADVNGPLTSDSLEFLSLLGHLDLPTHTINRMTPQNHIWYSYCKDQQGIHTTSGLPYSLIDLLSSVHIPGIEVALVSWNVPNGVPVQQCLWKATRFAGTLSAYHVQRLQQSNDTSATPPSAMIVPEVLVANILTLVQQCVVAIPIESASFKQTLIYPLVMAASQRPCLDGASKSFICQTISQLASERSHFLYRGILRVIRGFWQGEDVTIEATARRLNIELCLL
ncbi:hypothetical protein CC86DRAFT_464740 [Ophiobolus disseminans]|uniref:Zn(2)-C6 fungal-type domain-containing protein n=1 Tax=Ophiobolus disseminans TaxID=1469910 RepID=A0A6A7A778_9PLEO|nr:hypothetical protein CC86DRAFT_464740 [Ophiobolus disseminans]